MGDLKAFLAQNKIQVNNLKLAVSKFFVDEDGKPIEWEIKKISAAQDEELRKAASKQVKFGRKGQTKLDLDTNLYLAKLCATSVVFPNLFNAELQDSYGVKTPEELLGVMLDAGEYADLQTAVIEHNGFDIGLDDMVEEAKN